VNRLISIKWPEFVATAPASWKKDHWITTRSPVGVIGLYGQNQPIATDPDDTLAEQANWQTSRDYTKARWLSYAAATHYE